MNKTILAFVLSLALTPVALAGTTEGSPDLTAGLAAAEAGDFEKARAAFEAAAAKGNAEAKYHLGAIYHGGFGVQRSRNKAAGYYKEAAQAGNREAEYALGLFYHRGWGGLLKNPDTAVEWYTKAANKGSLAAQHNLGMMFATGEGVPVAYGSNPDYVKAHMWFSIVRKRVDNEDDRKKVDDMLASIEKHLTPGQKVRAKEKAETWVKENPAGMAM